MPFVNRRDPEAVAQLLIINAALYGEEKTKEISRYRFSIDTLRKISNRKNIQNNFLDTLHGELSELGWYLIVLDDEYAIINIEMLSSWVNLSSKRLRELEFFDKDDQEVSEMFYEKYHQDGIEEIEE
ncbi:hypothetical protein [Thiothrix lacustris]|uniref:hypothetical protein n=1 Tax=Thiothrix lacustris TaxID=525917 RepID=UPI0027E40125|nr:hypothetical protein [Thiothrix lacustris]WMP17222.1 hypothetical protein RCS87_17830 [Thiothrix lacustris]